MAECKSAALVYESAMARMERANKRLFVLLIIVISALILTNIGWIYYESQFQVTETSTFEAEQDGDGVNIIGGGDVNYGAESENNKDKDERT